LYRKLASVLTSSYLLFLASYAIATGDGIHDVAILLFPAFLVIISLLVHPLVFKILAATAVLFIAGVGVAEYFGLIHTVYSYNANWIDIVLTVVVLAMTAFIIRILVTDLLHTVQEAQKNEQNYREIFNATTEAIFLHDCRSGDILDVNNSMLNIYGYTREDIPHLSIGDLSSNVPPYTLEDAFLWIERSLTQGPQFFTWRARKKDGTLFWVEISLRATTIGGEGRVLAVVRDVDERKKIEKELRQSEKLSAIGQLAGGVAHDFNNQLGGILGYAEILRNETVDAEHREYIESIIRITSRAADLTGQLLSFARKGKNTADVIDVNRAVKETVSMVIRSIDKRIVVTTHLAKKPMLIKGDSSQIQNAILNLAINARDALDGKGEISFSTELVLLDEAHCAAHSEKMLPGHYVKLCVADTGCGMPPELLSKIFEPFFTTKPLGKGTGMGLAAVFGIVNMHGGAIEVHSEINVGSTFSLYLPYALGRQISTETA